MQENTEIKDLNTMRVKKGERVILVHPCNPDTAQTIYRIVSVTFDSKLRNGYFRIKNGFIFREEVGGDDSDSIVFQSVPLKPMSEFTSKAKSIYIGDREIDEALHRDQYVRRCLNFSCLD